MGGNVVYQTRNYDSVVNSRKSKPGINTDDSTHKLRGTSLSGIKLHLNHFMMVISKIQFQV